MAIPTIETLNLTRRFGELKAVVSLPLFFASNANYPILMMPHWLQRISHANPLTD